MFGSTEKELLICNREGQVLVSTSTFPDFQIGQNIFHVIHDRDARIWKKSASERDLLLRIKRGGKYCAALCTQGVWGIPELYALFPLHAAPAAFAALLRTEVLSDILLSPGFSAIRSNAKETEIEEAYRELISCRTYIPDFTDFHPRENSFAQCEMILRHLLTLPPLRGCQIQITIAQEELSQPLSADIHLWSGMLFCLCLFLYRITADAAISISLIATQPEPTVLLSARTATPIPAGACPLDWLTERYPNHPELTLCLELARRGGTALEAFGTADGALGISGQPQKSDPALYGLKQDVLLNDAEAEAKAREWCRLLPDAVPAKK